MMLGDFLVAFGALTQEQAEDIYAMQNVLQAINALGQTADYLVVNTAELAEFANLFRQIEIENGTASPLTTEEVTRLVTRSEKVISDYAASVAPGQPNHEYGFGELAYLSHYIEENLGIEGDEEQKLAASQEIVEAFAGLQSLVRLGELIRAWGPDGLDREQMDRLIEQGAEPWYIDELPAQPERAWLKNAPDYVQELDAVEDMLSTILGTVDTAELRAEEYPSVTKAVQAAAGRFAAGAEALTGHLAEIAGKYALEDRKGLPSLPVLAEKLQHEMAFITKAAGSIGREEAAERLGAAMADVTEGWEKSMHRLHEDYVAYAGKWAKEKSGIVAGGADHHVQAVLEKATDEIREESLEEKSEPLIEAIMEEAVAEKQEASKAHEPAQESGKSFLYPPASQEANAEEAKPDTVPAPDGEAEERQTSGKSFLYGAPAGSHTERLAQQEGLSAEAAR